MIDRLSNLAEPVRRVVGHGKSVIEFYRVGRELDRQVERASKVALLATDSMGASAAGVASRSEVRDVLAKELVYKEARFKQQRHTRPNYPESILEEIRAAQDLNTADGWRAAVKFFQGEIDLLKSIQELNFGSVSEHRIRVLRSAVIRLTN